MIPKFIWVIAEIICAILLLMYCTRKVITGKEWKTMSTKKRKEVTLENVLIVCIGGLMIGTVIIMFLEMLGV